MRNRGGKDLEHRLEGPNIRFRIWGGAVELGKKLRQVESKVVELKIVFQLLFFYTANSSRMVSESTQNEMLARKTTPVQPADTSHGILNHREIHAVILCASSSTIPPKSFSYEPTPSSIHTAQQHFLLSHRKNPVHKIFASQSILKTRCLLPLLKPQVPYT
jgi:hypothetical protein